ncbi:inorganic triphosphatase [Aestuariirhabdus litorea]|uniref:CYTH domain-containing protein n=1 Tax=Aestuariirhabdus litorea TaxID=2528527 RepID=A0A3P3VI73_9GAMM|nr:CYTH domain-containing protein [Aestuariirhabdus litorea]RRJ82372.1 CYTH domain-containing protein [Aestuariirhabdus litorea]RWW92535.1 CYTH domain-containing protein [Endozoicomonadaceae bacterium GTF-13]
MALETELKLLLSPDQVEPLRSHPLLQSEQAQYQGSQRLLNCYYDTPQFDLRANRVALRVRHLASGYIQTLKTSGERSGGLSRREEWEWPLASETIDLELLDEQHWPLDERIKANLLPCFNTDFERECWLLEWAGENPGLIEVALDQGQVVAGGRQLPICELELELKAGDERALQEVADLLSKTVELVPGDASKAQRGYRLMGQPE